MIFELLYLGKASTVGKGSAGGDPQQFQIIY